MRSLIHILLPLLMLFTGFLHSQTNTFRENTKWGIKENEKVIIAPNYDTIFNFDSTARLCLACFKIKNATASKFIKVTKTSFACNYLNRSGKALMIKNSSGDTSSIFSLAKTSVADYIGSSSNFKVSVKGKKYLVAKTFQQLTFGDYHDIRHLESSEFYIVQNQNEAEVLVSGLVDRKEKEIIPYRYSDISINPHDSLIIACSAGVRTNGSDDVFDYEGKLLENNYKHIELATKQFLVLKAFEPKEHFIIYNRENKLEKNLTAEEVRYYSQKEVQIRIKNDWYIYDLATDQRKLKK